MLEVFDKKVSGQDHIKSLNADLEREDLHEKFDLIVSSMTFHLLDTPERMVAKLKAMLNKNGRLAIIDLDKEDGSFHSDPKEMGVKHFGLEELDMQKWANKSKMKVEYQLINQIVKNEKKYNQFSAVFGL